VAPAGTLDALVVAVAAVLAGLDVLLLPAPDTADMIDGTDLVRTAGVDLVCRTGDQPLPTGPDADVVDIGELLGSADGRPGPVDSEVTEGRFVLVRRDAHGDPALERVSAGDTAASVERLLQAVDLTDADVVSSPLGLADGGGLSAALLAWAGGAGFVLADPADAARDPLAWLRKCARKRVTISVVTPSYLEAAAPAVKAIMEDLDLGSVRLALIGSDEELVSAEQMRMFNDAAMECGFDEIALCCGYTTGSGLLVWTMTDPEQLWKSRVVSPQALGEGRWQTLLTDGGLELVSCGRPLRGVELRVGDGADGGIGVLELRDGSSAPWRATADRACVADGELFVVPEPLGSSQARRPEGAR
jgi:acyl-CoA synthetase (AMP-forming)/AMP-acid ligase II